MSTESFDAAAATWDDNPRRAEMTRRNAVAIAAAVDLRPDMRVLEFGCGTGALSMLLAPNVGPIDAADTSEGMIDQLRRKLEASPELARKIRPRLLAGRLSEGLHEQWDLIYSAMVLHHIPDAEASVRHLAGRLAPGGHLALIDLCAEDGSFHGDKEVPHHGFEPEYLAEILEDAGLQAVTVRTVATIEKAVEDGSTREFPTFLLTARR
ncbi:MAG: class I SAM-dependent DNA methyltransferase [Phycisphaerae bacterium]